MGSIGPTKIPLVATLDSKGFEDAKAQMRALSQATQQTGNAAGSGTRTAAPQRSAFADEGDRLFEQTRTAHERYGYQVRKIEDLHQRGAISADTYNRAMKQAGDQKPKSAAMETARGIGGAVSTLSRMAGGPVEDIANLIFNPSMGMAAGAVAAVGLVQKFANNAKDIRIESAKLGMTTGYYQSLAYSARVAGVEMGSVVSSLDGLQKRSTSALTGNKADELVFRSLGISRETLERRSGNIGLLVGQMHNLTAGQKVQMFGDVNTANTVLGARGESPYGMDAPERAAMEEQRTLWGNMKEGVQSTWAKSVTGYQIAGTWIGDRLSGGNRTMPQIRKEMDQVAKAEEANQEAGKLEAARRDAAAHITAALMSPTQKYAADLTNLEKISPFMGAGVYDKARTAAKGELFSAQAPDVRWREQKFRDEMITRENMDNGSLPRELGAQRMVNIRQGAADRAAPVRSIRENIDEQLGIAQQQWNVPGMRADEKVDVARRAGMQVQDAANSLTRSGSLAGAYDTNSVAGYGQQVSMEFDAQKSADSKALGEEMLKNLPKEIAKAIKESFGFQMRPRGPMH